jgi:hypothetical protein
MTKGRSGDAGIGTVEYGARLPSLTAGVVFHVDGITIAGVNNRGIVVGSAGVRGAETAASSAGV